MKFLLIFLSVFAFAEYPKFDPATYMKQDAENARLCEICKGKIKAYKEMNKDVLDDKMKKKTLETYQKRHDKYCGTTDK